MLCLIQYVVDIQSSLYLRNMKSRLNPDELILGCNYCKDWQTLQMNSSNT